MLSITAFEKAYISNALASFCGIRVAVQNIAVSSSCPMVQPCEHFTSSAKSLIVV
jgi:hypothetical protein